MQSLVTFWWWWHRSPSQPRLWQLAWLFEFPPDGRWRLMGRWDQLDGHQLRCKLSSWCSESHEDLHLVLNTRTWCSLGMLWKKKTKKWFKTRAELIYEDNLITKITRKNCYSEIAYHFLIRKKLFVGWRKKKHLPWQKYNITCSMYKF